MFKIWLLLSWRGGLQFLINIKKVKSMGSILKIKLQLPKVNVQCSQVVGIWKCKQAEGCHKLWLYMGKFSCLSSRKFCSNQDQTWYIYSLKTKAFLYVHFVGFILVNICYKKPKLLLLDEHFKALWYLLFLFIHIPLILLLIHSYMELKSTDTRNIGRFSFSRIWVCICVWLNWLMT